jgi:hypothetical protein
LENLVALNLSSNCFSTCDLPVLTWEGNRPQAM